MMINTVFSYSTLFSVFLSALGFSYFAKTAVNYILTCYLPDHEMSFAL